MLSRSGGSCGMLRFPIPLPLSGVPLIAAAVAGSRPARDGLEAPLAAVPGRALGSAGNINLPFSCCT